MFSESPKKKTCEYCNKKYTPSYNQFERQRYCSLKCKWKQRCRREKELGIFKGGYNRETHIRLWLDAKSITDISAPCHYCGTTLYPEKFVIEHKIPRVKLNTKAKAQDITNLVVSCHDCNSEKSTTDYNEFMKRKHGRNK